MAILKVLSQSIKESLGKLQHENKQSGDFGIGTTVQPVVLVNNGVEKSLVGASTAGNAQYTMTVPRNKVWIIRSIKFAVTTDATVANRYCYCSLGDNLDNDISQLVHNLTVAASQTGVKRYLTKGATHITGVNSQGIDEIKLYGYATLNYGLISGVAGDSYTPTLWYWEFDAV